MDRPDYFNEREQMVLNDAEYRHVDTEKYDVLGSFSTGCSDGHRKVRAIVLLHEKKPSNTPWAIKGIDGTRCFHDFNSAVAYLIYVYGRNRPLTQRQYDAVIQEYHKHLSSGEPLHLPER